MPSQAVWSKNNNNNNIIIFILLEKLISKSLVYTINFIYRGIIYKRNRIAKRGEPYRILI